jgi:hypothetical protein
MFDELVMAFRYWQHRQELSCIRSTDYVVLDDRGNLIAKGATITEAHNRAIARGEKYPVVMSGHAYIALEWSKP